MFGFVYVWWFWLILMLLWFAPATYGWGYRGWGVPYPRYVQRRRMERAGSAGSVGGFNHQAWGRTGDFVWAVICCDLVFVAVLCLWR